MIWAAHWSSSFSLLTLSSHSRNNRTCCPHSVSVIHCLFVLIPLLLIRHTLLSLCSSLSLSKPAVTITISLLLLNFLNPLAWFTKIRNSDNIQSNKVLLIFRLESQKRLHVSSLSVSFSLHKKWSFRSEWRFQKLRQDTWKLILWGLNSNIYSVCWNIPDAHVQGTMFCRAGIAWPLLLWASIQPSSSKISSQNKRYVDRFFLLSLRYIKISSKCNLNTFRHFSSSSPENSGPLCTSCRHLLFKPIKNSE